MRVRTGTGALILLIGLIPVRPVGAGDESVATVSPGGVESPTAVVGTTPTFSWGSARAASAFELVVYEVPERAEAEAGQPTLRVRLPGSVSSWTPSAGSGLKAGRSYVWLMRALRGEATTQWSQERIFTISTEPSVEEVESALDVLRRYQEAHDVEREAVEQTGEAKSVRPEASVGLSPSGSKPQGMATLDNLAIDAAGWIAWDCPSDMERAGTWCIDREINAPANAEISVETCHNEGKILCPLEAIVTCDFANLSTGVLNSCGYFTDNDLGRVRTFGYDGDSNVVALNELLEYDAIDAGVTNKIFKVGQGIARNYFCCKPVSP